MIKAIIFDVGGVIYTTKKGEKSYLLKSLKLDKNVWEKAAKDPYENLVTGKINENTGLLQIANGLGIDKEKLKKTWIKTFKVRFTLNKSLLKIIKRLRKNYKTAILSDQWGIPHRALSIKKIESDFDAAVFSHQVGFRKPYPKIYRITLKRLKLKPSECIFIDDLEKNLVAARKLGMKTILFKNNRQLIRNLKKININI